MTMITFGLSATFPGEIQGQPHDAYWVQPVPLLTWTKYFYNGDLGSASGNILSNSLDFSPGSFDALTLKYGTSNVVVGIEGVIESQQISLLDISQWNSIKDIEISTISARQLSVAGFVDTWINAPTDSNDRTIDLFQTKRGAVALGDGNDNVEVNVLANEYTWSSHFDITAGNGNDTVVVQPQVYNMSAPAPTGWGIWNQTPQLTTADVTVGNGNDMVELTEVSGTIHVGSGYDEIYIVDGNSNLWLGAGTDIVTIGAPNLAVPAAWTYDTQVGSSIVNFGSGHADVTIDDTTPTLTPKTTLNFIHGETGGSTLATADTVRYGHIDPSSGSFVGGDLAALMIDLSGYSVGSTVTLSTAPAGAPMLLQIHDAATGSIDAVALYGSNLTSATALNLHFITP